MLQLVVNSLILIWGERLFLRKITSGWQQNAADCKNLIKIDFVMNKKAWIVDSKSMIIASTPSNVVTLPTIKWLTSALHSVLSRFTIKSMFPPYFSKSSLLPIQFLIQNYNTWSIASLGNQSDNKSPIWLFLCYIGHTGLTVGDDAATTYITKQKSIFKVHSNGVRSNVTQMCIAE